MSDTPFTDSVAFDVRDGYSNTIESDVVHGHYVRRLERERDTLKAGFDKEGRTAVEACCERRKSEMALKIQTLERELAAEKSKHTWKPIETAPKDGTSIMLLSWKNRICVARWEQLHFVGIGWFVSVPVCGGWGSGSDTFIPNTKEDLPTHWQPLPEPPNA